MDDNLIVPALSKVVSSFADLPQVFATAYLAPFIEHTCVEGLATVLPKGTNTLGIKVEITHSSATPVGMEVTTKVELIEVEGQRLRFAIERHDELDLISTGFHE